MDLYGGETGRWPDWNADLKVLFQDLCSGALTDQSVNCAGHL